MKKVGYLYLVSLVILVCLFVSCSKQEPAIDSGGLHIVLLTENGNVLHEGSYKDLNYLKTQNNKRVRGITQISAGSLHTVLIDKKGRAWAFGYNSEGQLGNGDAASAVLDYPVAMLDENGKQIKNIVQASAGGFQTALLDNKGYVWTVGDNIDGQLGNGDLTGEDQYVLVQMADFNKEFQGNIKQVSTGGRHIALLDNEGQVWTVGANDSGQLGNGDTTGSSQYYASKILYEGGKSASNIIQVAAGLHHVVMLDNEGYVWTFGRNKSGQLGIGNEEIEFQFSPILMIDSDQGFQGNIAKIAAGDFHTILLDNDGHIWTVGFNHQGQLGFGDDTEVAQYTPQMMTDENGNPIENIKQISGGHGHTLLLDKNNMVWIVGDTDLTVPIVRKDNLSCKYFPIELMQL